MKTGAIPVVALLLLTGTALASALPSCATLGEGGGGDENLPSAKAGPFRVLGPGELGNSRSAPLVMSDGSTFARDAAVVDLDGSPSTHEVAGYFGATLASEGVEVGPLDPTNAIVRHLALDGRSFDRAPVVVLRAEAPWEGERVGAPSVVRAGTEMRLYYAGAGGIGLARSQDGVSFAREPEPVLAPTKGTWEGAGVPASPAVVQVDDGSYRMFYEVVDADGTGRIGEARSTDGLGFQRVGDGAALAPSLSPSGDDDDAEASVGGPSAVVVASATGRSILRVYYAARSRTGASSIRMAARFGADGPLVRAEAPVFVSALGPIEPCVVVFDELAFLFVTQQVSASSDRPGVAAAVAPGNVALPPVDPP